MKNLDIKRKFLKFGEFQRKGHNEKELDPRQIKNIKTKEPLIYLTFDICPSNKIDEDMINWILANEIEASFFITVDSIKKHKSLENLLNNPRFTIGGHGYNHVDPLKQSNTETINDIQMAFDWWKDRGINLNWYRVPFGHPTEEVYKKFKELNLKCASWSGPVLDRKNEIVKSDIKEIGLDYINNNIQNGDLLIMHANGTGIDSFEILKTAISILKEKKFEFKKL